MRGCSLSSSGSWPGPHPRLEQHMRVQHQSSCSLCPSPRGQGIAVSTRELLRQLTPHGSGVWLHTSLRRMISSQPSYKAYRTRTTAYGCPDPWKHPSPALRCSAAEKQLTAALLLKLHVNKVQSTHGFPTHQTTTTLTLGGCVDPSHLRVCFSVLQQPNQVFPQESRGRKSCSRGFSGRWCQG